MPRVSVVIPTYNRVQWVPSAIRSVLDQTFQDFEVLVVDNGSTDGTRQTIASIDDQRIKYLRIDKNNGVSPARNLGIKHSNGKYVAFLDDDDEWLPRKLELQVSALEKSSSIIGGIYTGYTIIDRSTGLLVGKVVPTRRGNLFNELCITNCIGTASTVVLRTECFKNAGLFDDSIVYGEEWDLWIRISREFHFECIGEPLVKYSFHMSNSSSNWQSVIKGLEANDNKYGAWMALNRKGYSCFQQALGQLYCYTGNLSKGRGALLKAIRLHPLDLRNYLFLSFSLLGRNNFRKLSDVILKAALRRRERYYLQYGNGKL